MVDITGGPDFCKLVGAYGIKSARINENSQIDDAIADMLKDKESYLLVVDVNPYEPTGDAYNEDALDKREV